MRRLARAFAMIPQDPAGHALWFGHWCYIGGHFDFVSAEREEGSVQRDVVKQAVIDVFRLRDRDLLVANMAQINLEFHDQLLTEDGVWDVHVAFYIVNLYGQAARERLSQHPDGRWLTNEELIAGTTSDGLPVNPVLTALLRRADLLRFDEME